MSEPLRSFHCCSCTPNNEHETVMMPQYLCARRVKQSKKWVDLKEALAEALHGQPIV